jgi:CheY-like chemotaxis protein
MVAWPNPSESPAPSVLIADDNDGWRDVVGDVLAREGFRTLAATCGEEAIELVRHERLDVVLIDFHMPRLDGLQTLRIIRREQYWLPAVLMTAHPADLPAAEVRALRVETVLEKPVDRQVIVRIVTRVVRPW